MMATPVFSAHLGYLFTELPLPERFAAAAACGFEVVEHPAPFEIPAARLRSMLDGLGLRMAQVGTGSGGPGRKGLAALPGCEAAFRDDLARALDYAEEIGCPLVHPMAGAPEAGTDQAAAESAWLANIAFAMEAARGRAVEVFVEPISRSVVPGFALHRLDQYLMLADRLPSPPRLCLDTYHAAMNGENAADFILRRGDRIAHVHIADAPGRHEPGTGGFDFAALDAALNAARYCGVVGLEYAPRAGTAEGLGWRETWPNPRRAA